MTILQAYSRLPREPTIAEKPFLENDVLRDSSSESSSQLEKCGRVEDGGGQSKEIKVDDLNKPLPDLPEPLRERSQERSLGTRSILSSKSVNTRLRSENFSGGPAKQNPVAGKIDKRLISAPLRQNPVFYPNCTLEHELSRQIVRDLDNGYFPQTPASTADAGVLEPRANNMITSPGGSDARRDRVGDGILEAKDQGRPHTLQRSKVFAKVRGAIADRFSPDPGKVSVKHTKDNALPRHRLEQAQGRDSDGGEELDTNTLLKRRNAEEKNHSNYKTQFLTGVGTPIRRKRLPIYDSMKTAGVGTALPEDPFSDDHEVHNTNHKGSSSATLSRAISFKNKRKSRLLNTLGALPTTPRTSRESRFVEAISPPTDRSLSLEILPTSPKGYSTPKVRLEPNYDPNGKRKLAAFSFEEGREPFEVDAELDKRTSPVSYKRKKEEKGVCLDVTAKKAKHKIVSKDIETLTGRLGSLRTSASADLTRSHKGSVVAIGLDLLSARRSRAVKGRSGAGARETETGHNESPLATISDNMTDGAIAGKSQTRGAADDTDMDELQMDIPEHRLGSQRGSKLI
ncbi:hypothetical protein GP486_005624 [Trichoglossum hirsutum]|uniref:Uncharacterized protein n=1 Tax=Trichoglossum hirsutum TaxID=265104 RepID=A0A9P8L8V4_9PEZI|nr:hypothetical protein GP486_005624 [Trichoglossum hirsutum]